MLELVAHGTRCPRGQSQVRALASLVRGRGVPVRLSYVDVQAPRLPTLDVAPDSVVVPLLLAAGYHVRVDIPHALPTGVRVTPPVGPDPLLAHLLLARLRKAGLRAGDAVVLAAAGSSDPRAQDDVRSVAAHLGRLLGAPVLVGFASAAQPRVPAVVGSLRAAGVPRILIAAYLLADGFFYRSLYATTADAVTEPLGPDPRLADLVVDRYRARPPQAIDAHAGALDLAR